MIARVPFDEGSLTGTLTASSSWPEGDWRNTYFAPPHLADTVQRVAPLKTLAEGWNVPLPHLALRFVLANRTVTTTIPGMRRTRHVESNLAAGDAPALDASSMAALRVFRWDRQPDGRP